MVRSQQEPGARKHDDAGNSLKPSPRRPRSGTPPRRHAGPLAPRGTTRHRRRAPATKASLRRTADSWPGRKPTPARRRRRGSRADAIIATVPFRSSGTAARHAEVRQGQPRQKAAQIKQIADVEGSARQARQRCHRDFRQRPLRRCPDIALQRSKALLESAETLALRPLLGGQASSQEIIGRASGPRKVGKVEAS